MTIRIDARDLMAVEEIAAETRYTNNLDRDAGRRVLDPDRPMKRARSLLVVLASVRRTPTPDDHGKRSRPPTTRRPSRPSARPRCASTRRSPTGSRSSASGAARSTACSSSRAATSSSIGGGYYASDLLSGTYLVGGSYTYHMTDETAVEFAGWWTHANADIIRALEDKRGVVLTDTYARMIFAESLARVDARVRQAATRRHDRPLRPPRRCRRRRDRLEDQPRRRRRRSGSALDSSWVRPSRSGSTRATGRSARTCSTSASSSTTARSRAGFSRVPAVPQLIVWRSMMLRRASLDPARACPGARRAAGSPASTEARRSRRRRRRPRPRPATRAEPAAGSGAAASADARPRRRRRPHRRRPPRAPAARRRRRRRRRRATEAAGAARTSPTSTRCARST